MYRWLSLIAAGVLVLIAVWSVLGYVAVGITQVGDCFESICHEDDALAQAAMTLLAGGLIAPFIGIAAVYIEALSLRLALAACGVALIGAGVAVAAFQPLLGALVFGLIPGVIVILDQLARRAEVGVVSNVAANHMS